jgi:hypothetical protein
MADDKKEPWLNALALTTVILAVCATLSTFKGGGYSTRQMLSQAKASDQWAYYQAKGVKGDLYELTAANAVLQRKVLDPRASKDVQAAYDQVAADYAKRVARYKGEQEAIMAEARKLEDARDDAARHGAPFGYAVIFLQIAILLSSIAALLKRKPVWYLGLVVGVFGIVYFLDGFFLFI